MDLEKLRASLRAALEGIDVILAKASEAGRGLSPEEQTEHDGLVTKVADLETTLANAVAQDERKKKLSNSKTESVSVQILRNENHNDKGEYRGFKSLGEQMQQVRFSKITPSKADKRLFEVGLSVGMNEGTDSEGGFLVQSDFITELDKSAFENANLPQYCAKLTVTGDGIVEPLLPEVSRADGSRSAGARAYWEKEGGTITKSSLKFERLELKLRKLTALVVATDELLQDAPALGGYINEQYGAEMGFCIDTSIVEGSGVLEPKGFKDSAVYAEVPKVSGQAADTVVAGNITAMFAAVTPRGQQRGIWIVNPEVWGQLPLITIGNQPVFLPPGGLTGQQHATLLGRPVITVEACDALGDGGDIIFGDFKDYRWIEKGATEVAQSIHVYFDTDETAFRFIKRANGAPRRKGTITPYKGNGSFKFASFVGVADRA